MYFRKKIFDTIKAFYTDVFVDICVIIFPITVELGTVCMLKGTLYNVKSMGIQGIDIINNYVLLLSSGC